MLVPSLALACALASASPPHAPDQRLAPIDAAGLHLALEELALAHPGRARVFSVGESRGGRLIQALRVGAESNAPAILVVGGLQGPMAWTSALVLDHARALLARADEDEVAALLDSTTLYLLPRANPDACEARTQAPLAEVRGTGAGVDDDRDARSGEDDRADANGDGFVSVMRVPDPEGEWIEDPAEPRVLVRADRHKGERGRWKLVPEGLDDDGDGEVAEDPARDAEVDANFAHRWPELEPRAGRYPTDEPEALALSEFVYAHPEIALVLVYGEQGNLVGTPARAKPGRRGDELSGVLEDDAPLLEELGRRYREATGNEAEGAPEAPGSFAGWCAHHRGLMTLAARPFAPPAEAEKPAPDDGGDGDDDDGAGDGEAERGAGAETPEEPILAPEQVAGRPDGDAPAPEAAAEGEPAAPEPTDDARRLAWLEAHGVADAHLGWTPFEHPALGAVEVGGFRPYALVEPPPGEADALADGHLAFLLGLGAALPRPALVELAARDLGAGLYEVTGALENGALLPFATAAARAARTVRPLRVRLALGDGASLVAGARQVLVSELAGAGGRRELRWLVRAADPSAIAVELDSDLTGSAVLRPEVN